MGEIGMIAKFLTFAAEMPLEARKAFSSRLRSADPCAKSYISGMGRIFSIC